MVDIGNDQEDLSYLEWLIKDRLSKIKPSREYYSLKNILTAIKTKNKKMEKENIIGGLTKEEAVKLASEFKKEQKVEMKTDRMEIRDSKGNLRMIIDTSFVPEMEFEKNKKCKYPEEFINHMKECKEFMKRGSGKSTEALNQFTSTAMALDEGKNSKNWRSEEVKNFFERLRKERPMYSPITVQVLNLLKEGGEANSIAYLLGISEQAVRKVKKMLQENGHLPKIKRTPARSYLIKKEDFENSLTVEENDIYFGEKNLNVDMHKNDLLNKLKEDFSKKIKNNKTGVLTEVEIAETLTKFVVDVE